MSLRNNPDRSLDRIDRPDRSASRTLFQRIANRVVPGTGSAETLGACRTARAELEGAFAALAREVEAFTRWRAEARRELSVRANSGRPSS